MAKHVLIVDDFAAMRRVRSTHQDGALLAELHRAHDGPGCNPGNGDARFDLILGDVNLPNLGAAIPATVTRGVRSM